MRASDGSLPFEHPTTFGLDTRVCEVVCVDRQRGRERGSAGTLLRPASTASSKLRGEPANRRAEPCGLRYATACSRFSAGTRRAVRVDPPEYRAPERRLYLFPRKALRIVGPEQVDHGHGAVVGGVSQLLFEGGVVRTRLARQPAPAR